MNLLHFAETGDVVGGVERYLQTLLEAEPGDVEHAVVTHAAGPCRFAGGWPSASWPWMGPRVRHPAMPAMSDALPLFHAPPSPATLGGLAERPYAVFVHDHRWWCPSGSRYHHRTGAPCAIHAGTGACALRYHFKRCGSLRPEATLDGFTQAVAGRAALAGAAAVLCASTFMRDEAIRHGARAALSHVVPLPVPGLGGPVAATGAGEPPILLCASRLTPEKGIEELLTAFDRMTRESRLVLAGDGRIAGRIGDVVDAMASADRVTLAGPLDNDAMTRAWHAATAAVVPSVWPEPFGLVGIEALAHGRPVVTSGSGGSADWAREELGVLCADPRDPDAFAHALDRVVAESEWTRRAQTHGAPWVRQRHSLPAHVAALADALRGVDAA